MKTKNVKWTQRLRLLNKKITENDEAFKIKAFAKKVNLTALENCLKRTGRGQHPYPLWIVIAVWLYAYKLGIQEYRRVGKLCRSEDNFYWLSCGFEPSDAYFEQWKLRLLPLMPKLLESYTIYLRDGDLLNNDYLGLDGVKMPVWASLNQSKTEKQIVNEISRIEERLSSGEIDEKETISLHKRKEKLEQRKGELKQRKDEAQNKSDKEKEKMRINITTPETVILHRNDGQVIQGVNTQFVVNQSQVINQMSVERKTCDAGLLGKMYDKMCTFLSELILTIYLLADSGYWEKEDVKRFDPASGYMIIMPNPGVVAKERKKRSGSKGKGGWCFEDGFVYNADNNEIICPNKEKLSPQGTSSWCKGKYKRNIYLSSKKVCDKCKDRKSCLGEIKSKQKRISLPFEEEAEKNMKAYYEIPEHKELYKKRGVMNEPVHAQMYNNRGIVKFHTISIDCIEGEAALIALIHTLEKIERMYGSYFPVPLKNKMRFLFFCLLFIISYHRFINSYHRIIALTIINK